MRRQLCYILPFLWCIAACSIGKKYQQPAVQLPGQFGNRAPSDSSIAAVEWKHFFKDPVLTQLIDSAVKNSYDLQLATKRIEEARAYVKQAAMNYLPLIDLAVNATTSNPSNRSLNGKSLQSFLGKNHLEDYTLGATVSWDIYSWGKIKYQREAALADYLQTYEGARTVQTSLVAEIATGYYNLLMLDKQLNIAKRNIFLTDTLVNMMRLQKTAGLVTELAVQQTESQRQAAQLLVPQLEQQAAIQENTIRILSGELPSPIARTAGIDSAYVWNDLSAGFPAELLSRRPDVRAAEQALVAANALTGIAKASLYPSLNITASGGLNAFTAAEWFTVPASLFYSVAGRVIQPLLHRRELKTQYEVSELQKEEAVILFRQSVLKAGGEVVNAMVQLDKLKTQEQVSNAQVNTAYKATGNATLLFRSGLANYLEVITAQSNSLTAELNLADIQRQRLAAAVELYRSLGGGWN